MSKVVGTMSTVEYLEMRRKQSLNNAIIIVVVILVVFSVAIALARGVI